MELDSENKLLKTGLVIVATLVIAKLIFSFFTSDSKKKRLPPTLKAWPPLVGSLIKFLKGPIIMLREEYPKLGSVFTVNLVHKKITFLIGPEVSAHFFKASESDLSQQEVYQFNVPTFGPGVVFDVDYSVRQEQFRFFTEALRVNKLKGYVDMMVTEAEDYFSKWGESGEVDIKVELERLIILTASRCLLGREVRDQLFDDVSALFHDLDNGMLPISVLFPYLPIPAHRRRDRAREKLSEIFAKIIGSRKRSGKTENDMLQCFIESKYKDGRQTTESEVTGLLIAALFAGQHTSSITSTWTGAYLMRYKEYFSAALDEQKNLIAKHGDKIDHDILSEMDVLYRCIKPLRGFAQLQEEEKMLVDGKLVCVTGAGGYIASWIVKLLLERGYTVRGTVRNPTDPKNNHLRELQGAKERLTLHSADLLDYEALCATIDGCDGVFHTASPMTDDPETMLEPAVNGAKFVIDAAAKAKVKRVVFTSSIGAVYMNPNRDTQAIVDENCWSDLDFCKNTKNWYCYGKMLAEQSAWETAKAKGVDLVVLNPVLVLGPPLQSAINASLVHILKYLTGSAKTYANLTQVYVDVRDVALGHVLVYEAPSASGRYILAETALHRGEVVEILAKFFPEYPLPTKCSDEKNPRAKPYKFTTQKIKDLGLEFKPIKQSLYESVKSLQEKGHLPLPQDSNQNEVIIES